jgi:outer membrane lipoprotein-sorting protein
LLEESAAKLKDVQSVTMRMKMSGMGQSQTMDLKMMQGGYIYMAFGEMTNIMTPNGGWMLMSKTKQYMKAPAREGKGADALPGWQMLFPGAKTPTALGNATTVKFQDKDALRVEIKPDGPAPGGGKTALLFDPATKLPVGFEAGGSGFTMQMSFEDVKLDAGLTAKDFEWTPPAGWTKFEPPAPTAPSDYTKNLLKLGSKAPAFSLNTPAGSKMSLKTAMAGKKAVLVNFWFYG